MEEKESVFNITSKIVNNIGRDPKSSRSKAILAELRNSIGREYSQTIGVWPILYEYLPERFMSKDGALSNSEKAIITALQLYSIHQQGKDSNVDVWAQKGEWNNIGHSIKTLRKGEDTTAIDRRFNTLITSSTFDELIYHLRQMIRLLRRESGSKVSYATLANDLYKFLNGSDEAIKVSWGKGYYSQSSRDENTKEENDNE